jgi:hypothetical protein
MKGDQLHPCEGDTLVLTGIVHDKCVSGTGLPTGYKMAKTDQTFDQFPVEVVEIKRFYKDFGNSDSPVLKEVLILEKPNGETTRAEYRGREPIAGQPGSSIRASNSQGATQGYVWEKA